MDKIWDRNPSKSNAKKFNKQLILQLFLVYSTELVV